MYIDEVLATLKEKALILDGLEVQYSISGPNMSSLNPSVALDIDGSQFIARIAFWDDQTVHREAINMLDGTFVFSQSRPLETFNDVIVEIDIVIDLFKVKK